MAFFSKLKDRLFKSSSKIEEGLDAIVSEGGEEEAVDTAPDTVPPVDTPAPGEPVPDATEPAPLPHAPDTTPEPDPRLAPDLPEERAATPPPAVPPAPAPQEAPGTAPEPDTHTDLPEERAATPAPAPRDDPAPRHPAPPPAETDEPARPVPEPQPATPPKAPAPQSAPPPTAPAPQSAPAPAPPRPSPEPPAPAEPVMPRPSPEPIPEQAFEAAAEDAPARPGFFSRLLGREAPKTVVRRTLDDAMLESLEELLITADMGVDTALRVTANMAEGRIGRKLSVAEIKDLLASEIARIMEPVARPMPLYPTKPQVVLVVGVNGSGKTTTIGKLASQFRAAGKSVVIAAGDTFRAAAVEQLQVWGDRAGVPVMTAPEGTDPASLAFDAMTKAQADGADLLMIDTAGRLQNRADLMEELAKIVRVIRKKDPDAPHNTLLVLDATTGQNAVSQVNTFQELADVSGLVMTKLDGTAKGGVLVALADKFGLPIHAIGVGEQIDDLAPFDPEEFAAALVGLER